MTIECRTGCGEQIDYSSSYVYEFSDGFVYFLPIEKNGDVHNCPNFPKDPISSFTDEIDPTMADGIKVNANDYASEWYGFHYLQSAVYDEDISTKLRNIQLESVTFPLPFLKNEQNHDEAKYQLTNIATCYLQLKDYSNALQALCIQDHVTHDQSHKILDLMKLIEENKSANIDFDKLSQVKISPNELRNGPIRECERLLKLFIRKKYPEIKKLKQDFPLEFVEAERRRNSSSNNSVSKENDDVVENFSLGAIVKMMREQNKTRKWREFNKNEITFLHIIKDLRNDIDHFSDKNIEKKFSKDQIVLGYCCCTKIIKLLENLDRR